MEIQLQLDGNGRTTWSKPVEEAQDETLTSQESSNPAALSIDFSSKTSMTTIVPPAVSSKEYNEWRRWMDNILFDCEVSVHLVDSGIF